MSTAVDQELLQKARKVSQAKTDSALTDEALRALLARHRSAEVDERYKAYDEHPLKEPDEWGDLASFGHHYGARQVSNSGAHGPALRRD